MRAQKKETLRESPYAFSPYTLRVFTYCIYPAVLK